MKTLVTLAATALLTWSATAAVAAPPATVNFSVERGQVFGLALDGRPLTRPLARQVHVERLPPGQHWADFNLPSPYGPSMHFRTAVWLEPGLETSYVLLIRPGYGPQLRQVSAVPLYGPRGGYNGGYLPQAQPGSPYGGEQGGYYGGNPDSRGNYPAPAPAPYGGNRGGYGTSPTPPPAYPRGNYGNSPAPAPAPAYPGGYNSDPANGNDLRPLPPSDVQGLTQDLRNRPTDEERLDITKQALDQSSVRADELAQLISTLTYDRARIDLAEYGYAHVSDPQNFYRVYEVLHHPDSIREVQQALGLPQN